MVFQLFSPILRNWNEYALCIFHDAIGVKELGHYQVAEGIGLNEGHVFFVVAHLALALE